jgi:hypothetical protein
MTYEGVQYERQSKACSTSVSWMYKLHSCSGAPALRLVRSK